MTVKMN